MSKWCGEGNDVQTLMRLQMCEHAICSTRRALANIGHCMGEDEVVVDLLINRS